MACPAAPVRHTIWDTRVGNGDARALRNHIHAGHYVGLVRLGLLVLPGVLPTSISQVNGAKLWLRLGELSIQPGEFAKNFDHHVHIRPTVPLASACAELVITVVPGELA